MPHPLKQIIYLIPLGLALIILLPFALLFTLTFLPLHLWLHRFTEQEQAATLEQNIAATLYRVGKILLTPIWFPLFAATGLSVILSLWAQQIWTGKP